MTGLLLSVLQYVGWFSSLFLCLLNQSTAKHNLAMQLSDEDQSSVVESNEYSDSSDEEVFRIARGDYC